MISLLLAATMALDQGRITNGQVETRAVTQTLEREIAGIAARGDARWVGYRLPIAPG